MAGNWSVVGYPSDPIPDDPAVVAAQVDHINAVAADLAAQIAALPTDGAIDAVPWQSDTGAPEQFKTVVKKLPADLDKLKVRYQKVGAAMAGFQATLANAKAQAQANLAKAETAQNDIAAAQAGVAQMNDFAAQAQHQASTQNASAPPGTPPVQPHPWTGPDYHAQLSAAQAAFNAAKTAIDQAVNQFHDASRTAAAAVGAASQDHLTNDTSIWGSIVNAVESAAHWIAQRVPLQAISGILTKIAAVAGILSFIPIIGEVAAVVALVAVGLAFVCDGITALDHAYQGTFGWHDIITLGLDVVALAAGGAAVSLGRAATAAGEAAQVASASARQADAAVQAASATTASAGATVASDSARVAQLTTGNPIKVFVARLFGVTGRAQTALTLSTGDLARAQAAEMQALAAANAARASATSAAAAANTARTGATITNVGSNIVGAGGEANSVAGEPVGTANPAVALVRSTTLEIGALVNWNDDPTGSAAQSLGSQIPAEPIGVPSGG